MRIKPLIFLSSLLIYGIFASVNAQNSDNDPEGYLPPIISLLLSDEPEPGEELRNIALGQHAEQSSLEAGGSPSRAVDGDKNGRYNDGSVTHTTGEENPWWQVDLSRRYVLSSIVLHNRTDGCCASRLTNVHVFISRSPFGDRSLSDIQADLTIESYFHSGTVGESLEIELNSVQGRYVRVQLAGNDATLSLAEVEIFGRLPDSNTPYIVEDSPTAEQAASLLMSASFGPTTDSIDELVEMGYSDWFRSQQAMPINSFLDRTNPTFGDTSTYRWELVSRELWFDSAMEDADQLRQRASFALSQIFVVSTESRDITFKSHLHSRYMDILQEGVFGNFRDLIDDITYSPMMGFWLTYIGNEKADEAVGNAPDENYAREIMQLFTIGLLELNSDGTSQLVDGQEVETYDTLDVSELAKVFTGLWWNDPDAPFGSTIDRPAQRERDILPMVMFDEFHSPEAKSFLGHTIPAGTSGNESIKQALDVLFTHQNTAPFISKQLIQRMTTSSPSNAYVARVSAAFNSGTYTLPDGEQVGSGERGDMAPVWAAILFDREAHDPDRFNDRTWGKVREPLIRFIHWGRLSGVSGRNIQNDGNFNREGTNSTIGQNAYRANSVFNFYRPGFIAPGTETGDRGLLAPELQITTSTTIINYPNLMQRYILRDGGRNWVGNYSDQNLLANLDRNPTPEALIDSLDLTMTAGRMTERTKQRVRDTLESVTETRDRIQLAMLLITNSQEYNTQQ